MTAECTCLPYCAGGDGPEEDCPVHGRVKDLRGLMIDVLVAFGVDLSQETTDALLPVVRAYAAEQVRSVANGPRDCCTYCADLHARADEIEAAR